MFDLWCTVDWLATVLNYELVLRGRKDLKVRL